MRPRDPALPPCLKASPVRVEFGFGRIDLLGRIARNEGATRVLVVTDPGIVKAGHLEHASASLKQAGLVFVVYDGAKENPTVDQITPGLDAAERAHVDFLIGIGGGSAMDCCKGINLLLTNGGRIEDYWGVNKPIQPMLPQIMVPTTAGTGSEAQSFALISDVRTHQKMACGDRRLPTDGGLRPRVAILDPELTLSAPGKVAATAGIDAVAHAVESAGCNVRTDVSRAFSREAWRLLDSVFETSMLDSKNDQARADMLLGAHLAGAAIESAMLGAAHACANPLTAHCGLPHGEAVGLMLPHVIRFNGANGENPYSDLCSDTEELIWRVTRMREAAGLSSRLSEHRVTEDMIDTLASVAERQWTARFNPRPVDAASLAGIYRAAF